MQFFVHGTPKPQGSKRAFVNKHSGKASMIESAGQPLKDWRYNVSVVAREAMQSATITEGPVCCHVTFYLKRPKQHYLKTGLRKNAPVYPTTKPDIDKLLRAVCDSLTGIVWRDDSQVVSIAGVKYYSEPEDTGALIDVQPKVAMQEVGS